MLRNWLTWLWRLGSLKSTGQANRLEIQMSCCCGLKPQIHRAGQQPGNLGRTSMLVLRQSSFFSEKPQFWIFKSSVDWSDPVSPQPTTLWMMISSTESHMIINTHHVFNSNIQTSLVPQTTEHHSLPKLTRKVNHPLPSSVCHRLLDLQKSVEIFLLSLMFLS